MHIENSTMYCRQCLDDGKKVIAVAKIQLEKKVYSYYCSKCLHETAQQIERFLDSYYKELEQ